MYICIYMQSTLAALSIVLHVMPYIATTYNNR